MKTSIISVRFVLLLLCSLSMTNCATENSSIEHSMSKDQRITDAPCNNCHRSTITHEKVTGNKCSPCHNEAYNKQLRHHGIIQVSSSKEKFCYECHESRTTENKSNHPVIEGTGCFACHSPQYYPIKQLPGDKILALCIGCHKRELLDHKETVHGTGFRDGAKNLHYLHSGGYNKVSCIACHDEHASNQLHLIRMRGVNGKNLVTIIFRDSKEGGNCTTNCHSAEEYARNK